MPDTPRAHIRRPNLPWRPSTRTECARPIGDVATFMTRDDAIALIKRHGIRRAAFDCCMTCLTTANNYQTDLYSAMGREFYGANDTALLLRELTALQILVTAHRDEFDELVEGLDQTTDLAAVRRRRASGSR